MWSSTLWYTSSGSSVRLQIFQGGLSEPSTAYQGVLWVSLETSAVIHVARSSVLGPNLKTHLHAEVCLGPNLMVPIPEGAYPGRRWDVLELAEGVKTNRKRPCPPLERESFNMPSEAPIKTVPIWQHSPVCDEPETFLENYYDKSHMPKVYHTL